MIFKVGTAASIQSNGTDALQMVDSLDRWYIEDDNAFQWSNGNADHLSAGIVTVGGDLNVTGDYSVDEISAS